MNPPDDQKDQPSPYQSLAAPPSPAQGTAAQANPLTGSPSVPPPPPQTAGQSMKGTAASLTGAATPGVVDGAPHTVGKQVSAAPGQNFPGSRVVQPAAPPQQRQIRPPAAQPNDNRNKGSEFQESGGQQAADAQANADAPQWSAQSAGPSQTGYVNFGDYYNANAGAARQGALSLQNRVRQQGQTAMGDINSAENAYGKLVGEVTPGGPSASDFERASGYETQKEAQQNGLASGRGNAGEGVGYGKGQSPENKSAPNLVNAKNGGTDADNAKWAAGATNAEGGYTGPDSLADTTGYADLAKEAAGASDAANNLGTTSGIAGELTGSANTSADAALLSAAGGPGFARVANDYGNTDKALARVGADTSQSDAAKQQASNALGQYGLLANQEAATNAANAPVATGPNDITAGNDGFDPATEKLGEQYAAANPQGAVQNTTEGGAYGIDTTNQGSQFGQGYGSLAGAGINTPGGMAGSDTWWGGQGPKDPNSISESEMYSLATMTPDARAAWLKKHGG